MKEKENLKRIGENLRVARKNKGLTLEVTSGLAGISTSFLGTAERGESSVSLDTLLALCDVLDVSPNDIVSEGREIEPRPSDKLDTVTTMLKAAPDAELDFFIAFINLYRGRAKFEVGQTEGSDD